MEIKPWWGMVALVTLMMLACTMRVVSWKNWERQVKELRIDSLGMRLSESVEKRSYDCRISAKGIQIDVPLSLCITSRLDTASAGDEVYLVITKSLNGRMRAQKVVVVKNKPKPLVSGFWWQRVLGDIRLESIAVFNKILPEPESDLMAGIVLGEKGMLSNQFSDALIKTGTMHVVAASGYNVAVIAGVVMRGMVMVLSRRKATIGSMMRCLGEELPFWDRTIETIVVTHEDSDHAGGLKDIVSRYRVLKLVTVVKAVDPLNKIINKNIEVVMAQAGQMWEFPGFTGEVIWPDTQVINDNINDNSLVLRLISIGGESIWFAADVGEKVEAELLRKGKVRQTDILKVAHHGSMTATTEPFLEVLRPSQAGISVGKNNYGHPAAEVLARLEKYKVKILRTDQIGKIVWLW